MYVGIDVQLRTIASGLCIKHNNFSIHFTTYNNKTSAWQPRRIEEKGAK